MTAAALPQFLAAVLTQPLLRADAIVICCGEDAAPRVDVAVQLWKQGAAPILVASGGKHAPPRWIGAEAVRLDLLGRGVAPDRVWVEGESQHTREQAVAIAAMAKTHGWGRILLVASAYHAPRAFLTFVRALIEAGLDDAVHLIAVPTSQTPWRQPPVGMSVNRVALFGGEMAKLEEYVEHVATPISGIDYLLRWEGR